ncbi:NIL domain-containing protein, partial [Bifidobacterium longum]|uniref:NIL domain-containing protein n=1 Tax=Bifidobacterium longum TaxID=216816 RepID=UPI00277B4F7E
MYPLVRPFSAVEQAGFFCEHAFQVNLGLTEPITKGFGIDVNIIFGDIDIVADAPIGGIVAIFDGEPAQIDAALNYLRQRNI